MPVDCGFGIDRITLEGTILNQLGVDTPVAAVVDILERSEDCFCKFPGVFYLKHQPIGIWTGRITTRRLDIQVNCLSSSGEAREEQGFGEHGDKSRLLDLVVD